jgi:hypothetical protein
MGPAADNVRHRARSIPVDVVLLLLVLMCVSQVPAARGAAPSTTAGANVTGQVTIDEQKFVASVPSFAVLGENYSLNVAVTSTVNITVPIIIQLLVPVGAIYVHPRIIRASVQPNGSIDTSFSILPFGHPGEGPFNVTALLFVFFPLSMSSPQLVNQAEATVFSIGANPFPYLPVVLVSAGLVTLALVAIFYREIFRKNETTTGL